MLSTYVNSDTWGGFSYARDDPVRLPARDEPELLPRDRHHREHVRADRQRHRGTTFLGINLLVILSFPLVAALAYLVIRMTGLQRAARDRARRRVHVHPVPLGTRPRPHVPVDPLLGGGRARARRPRRQRALPARSCASGHAVGGASRFVVALVVMCVVVAWTGVYYVAFTLILGVFALLWRFAQRARVARPRCSRPSRSSASPCSPLIGFVPALLTLRADPPMAPLGERMAIESVTYAGNLAMADPARSRQLAAAHGLLQRGGPRRRSPTPRSARARPSPTSAPG